MLQLLPLKLFLVFWSVVLLAFYGGHLSLVRDFIGLVGTNYIGQLRNEGGFEVISVSVWCIFSQVVVDVPSAIVFMGGVHALYV